MTEGEKERIKHQANFFNGVALIWMATFAFTASYRVKEQAGDAVWWATEIKFVSFVAYGVFGGLFIHKIGQAALKRLERSPSAPAPSPPPVQE